MDYYSTLWGREREIKTIQTQDVLKMENDSKKKKDKQNK